MWNNASPAPVSDARYDSLEPESAGPDRCARDEQLQENENEATPSNAEDRAEDGGRRSPGAAPPPRAEPMFSRRVGNKVVQVEGIHSWSGAVPEKHVTDQSINLT